MSKASEVWDSRDVKKWTTALKLAEGQTAAIGEMIRIAVVRIARANARLRVTAPSTLTILRNRLYEQEEPYLKPLRPGREATRLCFTLEPGEWASIGDDVFVGVHRIVEGHVILCFKSPQGLPVCEEEVWKSLNGPSRDGMIQK
jgi:sRNA-binding carbon storage regulator CsrA